MAITRAKKESLLKGASEALSKAVSLVFVSFKGITVSEITQLRDALKKEGVKYTVVKKTLLKKALTEKNYEGVMPELPGEVAFAYLPAQAGLTEGSDVTLPARSLQAFVKKMQGKLAFLGGVLEGKYLSQAETVSVATIPATPVLRGMFVNVINSPIQRFAIALGEVANLRNKEA